MSRLPNYLIVTIIAALTLIIGGLIMACSAAPATSPATEEAVAAPAVTEEVAQVTEAPTTAPSPSPTTPPTATPTTEPTPSPTSPPSPTPAPVVVSDESCISCHTDQERLIATASEEEVVEALSEGEG